MPFEFVNKPVSLTRVEQLSPGSFKQYRNKHPIIFTKIISDWLPVTKWKRPYLQEALEQYCSKGVLEVFTSFDNRLFINNPEVVRTINISPKDFFKHVFDCQEQSEKQRFYLRTHSMPDALFEDINIPAQIKSLLDVLCFDKDDNIVINRTVDTETIKETTEQSATCSPDEELSPWEEMLTCCPDEESDIHRVLDRPSSSGGQHDDSTSIEQKLQHFDNASLMDNSWQKLQACIFNQPTMQLWIGTQGNVTPLHYDRNHGLLAQIVGRKELTLFSHEDTPNLYPHVSYSERAHTSRVDLRKVYAEEERFPRLKNAQPYTCTLEPGELLYMPPFWWHDVTSLDDCVSVTLPWDMDGSETVPGCMLT